MVAAGLLKAPFSGRPAGAHIADALLGVAIIRLASYLSARLATRDFETRTLFPFAVGSSVSDIASPSRPAKPAVSDQDQIDQCSDNPLLVVRLRLHGRAAGFVSAWG